MNTGNVASEVKIRAATAMDADEIAELLTQLGHSATPDAVIPRLQRIETSANDRIVVAEDEGGQLVGLIGMHLMPLLHRPKPTGRVTVLVVRDTARRNGIGRQLMAYAAQEFRQAGCDAVEVTSNLRRTEAHAFYRDLGFKTPSAYFKAELA